MTVHVFLDTKFRTHPSSLAPIIFCHHEELERRNAKDGYGIPKCKHFYCENIMTKDNEWSGECFYCDSCGKPFRSPLYDITKEYQYTTFYDSSRIPEVEIMGAEVIANYCSATCREKHRNQILKREKIHPTYPNIGPTETCSRCNGPVLMTKFHLAFVETDTEQNWEQPIFGVNVINSQVMSIVCTKCEQIPLGIARAIDWDS